MKEKTAYLRGLMDGMKLADDDNTRLFKAVADCLDAIAEEVEAESARTDNLEADVAEINDDIDEMDEILGFLIEEEEDDGEEDREDWEDDFDFFTCPNCGEIVPLTEDMQDPICPKCNEKLFGDK